MFVWWGRCKYFLIKDKHIPINLEILMNWIQLKNNICEEIFITLMEIIHRIKFKHVSKMIVYFEAIIFKNKQCVLYFNILLIDL